MSQDNGAYYFPPYYETSNYIQQHGFRNHAHVQFFMSGLADYIGGRSAIYI